MSASARLPAARTAIRALRAPLLRWYRRHRRNLPWRRTTDAYAIWVSEAMLQQTQVATVIPYYARFLARFPDLRSLAAADDEAVLATWSGLGYYRRALSLRDGARAVLERHGGAVPADREALLALPGVGRYTAGAIASLAHGREEPVLDGNVRRVFSRLFAYRATGSSASDAPLWNAAACLVRGTAPGDLNQALMELGALVCTPRAPRCSVCPVAKRCAGRLGGNPERFPPARATPPPRAWRVAVAVVEHEGRVLLERPGPDNPFRGMWDLPAVRLAADEDAASAVAATMRSRHGIRCRVHGTVDGPSHAILSARLRLVVVRASATPRPRRERTRWVAPAELDTVAVSSASRKALASAAHAPSGRAGASSGGRAKA